MVREMLQGLMLKQMALHPFLDNRDSSGLWRRLNLIPEGKASKLSAPRSVFLAQCSQVSVPRSVLPGQYSQASAPRSVLPGQCSKPSAPSPVLLATSKAIMKRKPPKCLKYSMLKVTEAQGSVTWLLLMLL